MRITALTGVPGVRKQVLPKATIAAQKAYFEVKGRPGSQPESVHTPEVQQRCDTQQVNSMTQRECHLVAAKSDTQALFPAFFNLGLHNPSRDHSREGQVPSISSPKRDPYSFPARLQTGDSLNHQHPTRSSPRCQGDDPRPLHGSNRTALRWLQADLFDGGRWRRQDCARSSGSQRRAQPQSATTSGWGSSGTEYLHQQTLHTKARGVALKAPINGAQCIEPHSQLWAVLPGRPFEQPAMTVRNRIPEPLKAARLKSKRI
jgi:hypothetical protein